MFHIRDLLSAAKNCAELRRRTEDLETKTEYLHLEVSKLRSLVRYLAAERIHDLPLLQQTMDSFDFQWQGSVSVGWTPKEVESIKQTVAQYTDLDSTWFSGKRVLDAGCGSGRFSYAMASMGAEVTAVDQSASAVARAAEVCAGLPANFRQHNLLEPLPFTEGFDLVWSFGVLHHTGDTYRALQNIVHFVKPGGYLFLMLYGEPTFSDLGSFAYYIEVENMRRDTTAMTFDQRHEHIIKLKGKNAGGWFDAVSPIINDTYSFHEIQLWLKGLGFSDIRRTVDHPSHHVVARKNG